MFVVIEYKRDIEIANQVLSGATLKLWTLKSKAVMGLIRMGHKGDNLIETENGYIVYQEGTIRNCKNQIMKLNKKLIDADMKDPAILKHIKDRIFNLFRKKAKKILPRLEGRSALSVLNQAGILVTWKTQNQKPN